MTSALLSAQNILVKRSGRTLIHDVSLDLQAGQITTLIGPNGAGKSTLVRTLLGLQDANAGSIIKQTGLRIGYMPQKLNLEPTLPLTVQRFLDLGLGQHQLAPKLLTKLSKACRIEHLLTQPMQYLSGGETQRVLLLRALLNSPHLLILDEPVQGVDISGQVAMYELIVDIRDQLGCGILMISHDLHMVAAATDQVICLNQHVCCSGHPQQVSQDPAIIELFGVQGASALAVYNHQHNHHHDSHGTIIPGKHSEACHHD
ncbi:MAG: zinc ABC transporter ATP-binding protein ZnuC [Gammaproteobacteria bacterium]|nr:zinc ABC transporter ATP-binding protein ZnuC [Gammaproteobacteria bacterium]MDP6165224.1 zinc ABC transporter ATP-binding protein ZnuC [Gammaproteobacteria bacterium]